MPSKSTFTHSDLGTHYSALPFISRICKPDSVASLHADGHFSTVIIAHHVVAFVSKRRCNQPEDSPSRVIVFCLVLHRARVAVPNVAIRPVASLCDSFNLTNRTKVLSEDCFLLPCLAAYVAINVAAVSGCAALWCPDFPHCRSSAAIRPANRYYS